MGLSANGMDNSSFVSSVHIISRKYNIPIIKIIFIRKFDDGDTDNLKKKMNECGHLNCSNLVNQLKQKGLLHAMKFVSFFINDKF